MRNGDFSALLGAGHHHLRPADRGRRSARAWSGSRSPATSFRPTASTRSRRRCSSYYPLPNQTGERIADRTTSSTRTRAPTTSTRVRPASITRSRRSSGCWRATRGTTGAKSRNADLRDGQRHRARPATSCSGRTTASPSTTPATQSANSLWDFRGGLAAVPGAQRPAARGHCSIRRRSDSRRSVVGLFGGAKYFPLFDFDTLSDIGDNLAGNTDAHHLFVSADLHDASSGSHSVRAGYDLRHVPRVRREPGPAGGRVHRHATAAPSRGSKTTRRRRISRTSRASCSGYPDRRLDRAQRIEH